MPSLTTPFHQADLLLIVLLWASLRFGMRGAATASFAVSAMAVWATAIGYGPFVQPELRSGLLSLQTFMAGTAATCLVLGATAAEKRVALEDMRQAQEDAARANLAKSEFLAVMSHELRTPLNAITGFAELLRSDVHGHLNDAQADDVNRIARNEKKLLEIIDQVLGFVSAEKGTVRVEPRVVKVASVFDMVEPIARSQFDGKHFVLRRDLARPRLAVQADPKSLQQILLSLLSNASKYTKEGGNITLGAEPQDDRNVRIWVSDSGVGIPQAWG